MDLFSYEGSACMAMKSVRTNQTADQRLDMLETNVQESTKDNVDPNDAMP